MKKEALVVLSVLAFAALPAAAAEPVDVPAEETTSSAPVENADAAKDQAAEQPEAPAAAAPAAPAQDTADEKLDAEKDDTADSPKE